MTELSPAARAVLTAVTLTKYDVPPEGLPAFAEEMAPLIAAALRAAADQVVPESKVYRPSSDGTMRCEDDLWIIRRVFYAIANELEAQ